MLAFSSINDGLSLALVVVYDFSGSWIKVSKVRLVCLSCSRVLCSPSGELVFLVSPAEDLPEVYWL